VRALFDVTVYEKGAEVVRMYETLLGADGFRAGMDLYFERHDGQGLTLVHFSAQLERCLTHINTLHTLHTLHTPYTRATQHLRAPPIP
jgi:aminopeptidase N